MGRGASDKDAYLEGATFFDRFLVVPCDVPLDLVMQAAFVRSIVVPGNLDAVHSQVSGHDACVFGRSRRHLRQSKEGASVMGPTDNLRQVRKLALLEVLDASTFLGERMDTRKGRLAKGFWSSVFKKFDRI